MGTLIILLLESSVCLAVFYLFFKGLFSKETFHRFNRIAVLTILILAAVIPFLAALAEGFFKPVTTIQTGQIQILQIAIPQLTEIQEKETLNIPLLLLLITYFTGMLVAITHRLIQYIQLFRLLKVSRKEELDNSTRLRIHQQQTGPFSWFNQIVVSEKDLEENRTILLTHELAHIHHKHSLDLLLADFCILLQWFNPAAWLLKQELQAIHEFEADETVLNHGIDAQKYQLLIIRKAVGTRLYSMANSFNHSSLKKRITMMKREKSSPVARWKFAAVLPLAGLAVLVFAQPAVSDLRAETSRKLNQAIDQIIREVDETPTAYDKSSVIPVKKQVLVVQNSVTGKPSPEVADTQSNESKTGSNQKEEKTQNSVVEIVPHKSNPLVVVDNKIISDENTEGIEFNRITSDEILKKLNLTQIESITVLKNESATKLWGARGANGVILISTKKAEAQTTNGHTTIEIRSVKSDASSEEKNKNATVADVQPKFPGGIEGLNKYIKDEFKYPQKAAENNVTGVVLCQFVVNQEGKIENIKVVKGISPECDEEAVRVVSKMPDWTPGKSKGKNVAVNYSLPIKFSLTK